MKLFRDSSLTKFCKSFPDPWGEILDFVKDVVIVFLVVLLIIRPIFFSPFQVKQQSMMPNILDGEYILVWKLPYHTWSFGDYERNDIVVFLSQANSDKYLIKRIIGLPGETIRFQNGYVWVKEAGKNDFRQLDESFLSSNNLGNTCFTTGFCSIDEKSKVVDIQIPADRYFVIGDNRLYSRDARSCFINDCTPDDPAHFLGKEDIEGRVFVIFARIWDDKDGKSFSVKNARWITTPSTPALSN